MSSNNIKKHGRITADEEIAKASIVKASYKLPSQKVETLEEIEKFFNSDGGY